MREQRSGGGDGRPAASPTGSSSSSSAGSSSYSSGGGGGGGGTGGDSTPNGGVVQFLPIRSRVGKRFQAAIPELLDADARAKKKKMQLVHVPRSRFTPERAKALGDELERYLALARTLRDGATLETEEQVHAIALQYLHRFDYNATDAACSLYARHSIEVPTTSASASGDATSSSNRASTSAEDVAKWLAVFYELMRTPAVCVEDVARMQALHDRAQTHADIAPLTEAAVLSRLVARIRAWEARSSALAASKVARGEIAAHVHAAEDMALVAAARGALEHRMRDFDAAFSRLKDAIDRGSRRNQPKVTLDELERLYAAVTRTNVAFPEEVQYTAVVLEARELARTIAAMLREDKVSLPAMRDVMAKIELVPVSFEREVEQFQQKMLSAQTWLAKARKCIPKRRGSRRSGSGSDAKKLDLDAIRALVDDAPCDDSAEMFEMQDLLECADEWAEKVKRAIEGGAEIALDELKELFDEGNDMPVDMDEQKFLEAEIAAREWCVKATAMLAARKPLRALEGLVDDAKAIRTRLHSKKQARWKPQVERDIHAAIDTARRWLNEVRDVLGPSAFDKLLSSGGATTAASSSSTSSSSASSDHAKDAHEKAKKPLASIDKLIDKSERLVINVSAYVDALKALQGSGYELRDEVRALLVAIGCMAKSESAGASQGDAGAASGSDDNAPSTTTTSTTTASEATPVSADSSTESSTVAASESSQPSTLAATTAATSVAGSAPADVGVAVVNHRDFAYASTLLERVHALPFHFDEGLTLEHVLVAERDWAQRVRDALPPRQSRKKRQAKHPVTLALLEQLLRESKTLHFRFPDELKVLAKELEELGAWQLKARDAVETPVAERIAQLVPKLRAYDLEVYEKLQAVKAKLAAARNGTAEPSVSESTMDVKYEAQTVKDERDAALSNSVDAEMADVSSGKPPCGDAVMKDTTLVSDTDAASSPSVGDVKPEIVLVPVDADAILSRVRLESGCMQRQRKSDDDNGGDGDAPAATTTTDSKKNAGASSNGAVSLLEPVLAMTEKSLEAIAVLEARGERVNVLETIELAGDGAFTDDAVKVLEAWHDQIAQVVDEGELLSAVAPELQSLASVVDLLAWLQSARSLFYDEMLPLRELVTKGQALTTELQRIRASGMLRVETLETLELMLWPLPYLEAQDTVVQNWTARVCSCIAAKRVRTSTLQSLLLEGDALLMEPDAFKVIDDEVKRAKAWLAKLKKRVKALITKRVARLSMSVARSFVDDGEDVVVETPVFDYLKDNVEVASDWETRVLASGIETGHARIAHLVALLNEYDCAGLIIDLDMHREVLQSATERYCICRQPFDGLMIGCDLCDDWFHDNCIGMSKEKAEKVEHYTCPSCTLLQDLASAVQSANGAQPALWDDAEYVKSFEKHHGVLTRKLKREEKAVEKSEMQLFSCSNQMNHLRVAIEELERRKSAAAVGVGGVSDVAGMGTATPTGGQRSTSNTGAAFAAAVETPHSSLQPQQSSAKNTALVSEGVHEPLEAGPATITIENAVAEVPVIAALPAAVELQAIGVAASPATPNILLPLAPAAPSVAAGQQLTGSSPANGVSGRADPTTPTNAVNRIAALVAAGDDIEAHLTKMRNEHAELMLQAHDAQESLRLSKERLQIAQDGLKELRSSHAAREAGLPLVKAWVHRAVAALNTPSLLARAKLPSGAFVPDAYDAILAELAAPASEPLHWTAHIDTIFPEVRVYARLLRLVGWTLVVVSLLQERPSRESLSSAIAYAMAHSLWDGKTVGPLRGVLGRMDAWIAKVHKSIAKTGLSKSQRLPRLKLFLNEYSKLPLTCTPLVETLEAYVQAAEATAGAGVSADQVKLAHDTAEAAVIAAFANAATALSVATAAAAAGVTSGGVPASSAQFKAPRKRKLYARREKPPGSVKKSKKSAASTAAPAAPAAPTAPAATGSCADADATSETIEHSSGGDTTVDASVTASS